ncbi:cytochrome P450 [Phaeacidiphilus oryzae]|uniref:cytochrome P450 n=1 Tax=Phaeacidiphilus oryzae TaxID=348818 RepID=UPI00055A3C87|nr:cytochrome P450 [Phaeacidiphilus oryzae]
MSTEAQLPQPPLRRPAQDLDAPFPWPRPPIDPPAVYSWLRAEEPVRRVTLTGGRPGWLVTRYDDVRAVLADPRASSDGSLPGYPWLDLPPIPPEQLSFLRTDPPQHTVFRRLLRKNFLIRRAEALRPRIQALVDETLDAMLARTDRPVDLVDAFALPIPSTVLAWIMGVPSEDRPFFNRASEELLGGGDPDRPGAAEAASAARRRLHDYLGELVAAKGRLADPGDDILGQLVAAVRAGTIPEEAVLNAGITLLVAGHETTANMTSLGVLTLLQHPEQRAELAARPELVPGAVEELLRYLGIVHLIIVRVAKEDIEIGGTTIPAGEAIIPLNLSGNRDGDHYPDPDRFDIHRAARDHLAFGFGVHQCLGAPLARIELQIIFETLLRRVPGLRLAMPESELPFKLHAPINGLFRLPVTW